jgi:hypothetical protein
MIKTLLLTVSTLLVLSACSAKEFNEGVDSITGDITEKFDEGVDKSDK